MIVVSGRNVNQLYRRGLTEVVENGVSGGSRNGRVIAYPCPVTSVYERPTERVLFEPSRDANPFFHLMESIWMLAGRRDAAFLTRYAKQIGAYAENNGVIHGAYGWRWRHVLGFDQLDTVVQRLRQNPDDRQCVIQMWDSVIDLRSAVRDRPCNTHVYLRVRRDPARVNTGYGGSSQLLDLTVCCRSNDLIWGAYGANAVHFSVLQEYLAAAIGVGVGKMYQVSNNLHVYDNDLLRRCVDGIEDAEDVACHYATGSVRPMPMVAHPDVFLDECEKFCAYVDHTQAGYVDEPTWINKWFAQVAAPVAKAHWWFKTDPTSKNVVKYAACIEADDWRLACAQWLQRRTR